MIDADDTDENALSYSREVGSKIWQNGEKERHINQIKVKERKYQTQSVCECVLAHKIWNTSDKREIAISGSIAFVSTYVQYNKIKRNQPGRKKSKKRQDSKKKPTKLKQEAQQSTKHTNMGNRR